MLEEREFDEVQAGEGVQGKLPFKSKIGWTEQKPQ